MKRLTLKLETGDASAEDLRPILDRALSDHFDDSFLHHEWDGDVLRLSGPGARGTIVQEEGHLKLEARLRPPASLIHRRVRREIEAAMSDVAAALNAAGR